MMCLLTESVSCSYVKAALGGFSAVADLGMFGIQRFSESKIKLLM